MSSIGIELFRVQWSSLRIKWHLISMAVSMANAMDTCFAKFSFNDSDWNRLNFLFDSNQAFGLISLSLSHFDLIRPLLSLHNVSACECVCVRCSSFDAEKTRLLWALIRVDTWQIARNPFNDYQNIYFYRLIYSGIKTSWLHRFRLNSCNLTDTIIQCVLAVKSDQR